VTNYVDIPDLQTKIYFHTATLDDRYVWEEIKPGPAYADLAERRDDGWQWADGTSRYRLLGCAHREQDRDGVLCTHCGDTVATAIPQPPEQPVKRRGRRGK
jgi:hypothetical protein